MMNFNKFLTTCPCGNKTSKTYARAHEGRCKSCVTGLAPAPRKDMLCPTCGECELTAYQKAHHYHCDACTREADPEGYRQELLRRVNYPDC